MLFLRSLLKFKGVNEVNNFLSNGEYLTVKKANEVADFFRLYLKQDFTISCDNPFQIFTFLKIKPVLNNDELISSRYFETMPNEYVKEALRMAHSLFLLYRYDDFANYLISKIDKDDILGDPAILNYMPMPITTILNFKDIDFLEKVIKHLSYPDLMKVYIQMGDYFSLADCRSFLTKTEASFDIILSVLTPLYGK